MELSLIELKFPENQKEIGRLSYDQKMEWYASRDPKELIFLGNDEDFQRFWYWKVLLPVRLGRMYYKIKNFQFRKHQHITEMKAKTKKHSI